MARFIFLVFALLFFVSGYFWRLHVERGQYYIFLTFILSLAVVLDMKQKSVLAIILLGLLSILRPTFLIIIPLLLFMRRWKAAGIMALASLAIFALSLIASNIQLWDSYVKNVYLIERSFAGQQYSKAKFEVHKIVPESAEGIKSYNMLSTNGIPFSTVEVLRQIAKRINKLSPAIIMKVNVICGVCFLIACFLYSIFDRKIFI